jgi:hypothetical protein
MASRRTSSPSVAHPCKAVALASLTLGLLACGGAIVSPGGENAGGNAGRGSGGSGPGDTGGSAGQSGQGGSAGMPGECPPGQSRSGSTCVTPPPPPPPPVEVCPADRPREGTYCSGAPSMGCTYVASFCMSQPNGWATYSCVDNIWRAGPITIGPCNPYTCPGQVPTAGTPCVPSAGGDLMVCRYACTAEGSAIVASCGLAFRWTVAAQPCVRDGGIDEPEGPGDAAPDTGPSM